MAPADTRNIVRLATWIASAYLTVLLLFALWASVKEGEAGEFLVALPGVLWLTLPVAFAAGLVGASSTRLGGIFFLLLEAVLIFSLFWVIVANRGQGAIIGLIFVPIAEAGAIILAVLIASAFGWRMRPDFLLD